MTVYRPAYPSIFSQLAPRDARLLNAIYEDAGGSYRDIAIAGVAADAGITGYLAVENLERLRLIKPAGVTFPGPAPDSFDEGCLTQLEAMISSVAAACVTLTGFVALPASPNAVGADRRQRPLAWISGVPDRPVVAADSD